MLFRNICIAALTAFPIVRAAYTVETPAFWSANTSNYVRWTSLTTDPATFSIELIHPQNIVNGALAIANNVNANLGQLLVPLPRVPASGGYTLNLINPGNITDVYAASGTFEIRENDTSTLTSTPGSSSSGSGTVTPPSGTAGSAIPVTGSLTTPPSTSNPPATGTGGSIPVPSAPVPFAAAYSNSAPALLFSVALAFTAIFVCQEDLLSLLV